MVAEGSTDLFLVGGKSPFHRGPCNLIRLDAFELGASRFPGMKRVRAKDAKDAKVRKGDY